MSHLENIKSVLVASLIPLNRRRQTNVSKKITHDVRLQSTGTLG